MNRPIGANMGPTKQGYRHMGKMTRGLPTLPWGGSVLTPPRTDAGSSTVGLGFAGSFQNPSV
jgi:hypothetical protein